MKPVAVLLAVLALVLAPFTVTIGLVPGIAGPGLPWEHFSDSAKDAVSVGQGGCAGEVVLVARLLHDGTEYAYFAAENGRFLFAEMKANEPVTIFVGAQLPEPNQDLIKVLDSHPFSADRDGDGPCPHLFPASS